jgi:hypothetical protein
MTMELKETVMNELTRREFLRITTTTISAAFLGASEAFALLPPDTCGRDKEPAYRLAIDSSGYIYDPDFSYEGQCLPSYRDILDERENFSHLSTAKQREILEEWFCLEEDEELGIDLDEEADLDLQSPRDLALNSEYGVGIAMYEELDWDSQDSLGLCLVEGEYPGHIFTAVKAREPEKFQASCLRHGFNIEVVSIGYDYW